MKLSKVAVIIISVLMLAAGALFAADYMTAGVNALKAKQYDKAIQYLSYGVKSQPSSNAYYYLGQAYLGKGNKAGAMSSFQQAVKLNPSNAAAKQMVAKLGGGAAGGAVSGQAQQYLAKGHQFLKAKRYDNAIQYYQASAKAQPSAQAYQFMGTAYYYKGDKANAKMAYEKSLQLNPNNAGVRSMLSKLGGGGGEQRLGEQLGVHPLILAGLAAGALVLAWAW